VYENHVLRELQLSIAKVSDSFRLLQRFRECWPVGTISASTWGSYESAIPVSNDCQAFIECQDLFKDIIVS